MALKYLELSEMAGLSAAWVGPQRPLLLAIPQTSAWLPQIDEVHARVVRAQPVSFSAQEAEIAEIVAQQVQLDQRHDELIRATSLGLETEQALCRGGSPARLERAALCERALKVLLPRGLLVINALYIAEAGNAAQTRGVLASEAWLRELLASIPTSDGGSLLSVVEAWCGLGEQLGQLEEKKAAVQARITSAYRTPRAEILAARNAWLALVNMILGLFDLIEGHDEAIEALRGPILRTAEIASKRAAPRTPDAPATPTPPAAPDAG